MIKTVLRELHMDRNYILDFLEMSNLPIKAVSLINYLLRFVMMFFSEKTQKSSFTRLASMNARPFYMRDSKLVVLLGKFGTNAWI